MTQLDRRLSELKAPTRARKAASPRLSARLWAWRWWLFGLACGAFWLGVFVLIERAEDSQVRSSDSTSHATPGSPCASAGPLA